MIKKLFVGNLGLEMTNGRLSDLFAAHGTVESARIVMDRDTGISKGFAFVEMKTVEEAVAAVSTLNGHDSDGQPLTVREAKLRPKEGRGSRAPRSKE